MIDPTNMTRYNQDKSELEETILFCCSVAGKNAMTTSKLLDVFLRYAHDYAFADPEPPYDPFDAIRGMFTVGINVALILKDCGFGCYNHRAKTFKQLVYSNIDLETCTTSDLEAISGIGMKTSRFFILHSRKDATVAPVDTHVCKFLKDQGIIKSAKVNLTPKRYLELEKAYIDLWKNKPDIPLAEYDLAVWNHYAGHQERKRQNKIESRQLTSFLKGL